VPFARRNRSEPLSDRLCHGDITPRDCHGVPIWLQGGNATTGGVLFNRFNVSQEHDAEFNAWYNQEHLPQLAAVKGSVSNRRFRAREGDRLYLARYDLLDPNVPSTEAWRAVVATPWTKKMSHVWRDAWRTLFVPLGAQRLSSAE